MQIWLLILIMAVFWHDSSGDSSSVVPTLATVNMLGAVFLPKLTLALLYALACKWAIRTINRKNDTRWVGRLDHITMVYRFMALVSYGTDLSLGALTMVRRQLGDLILLDELLLMLLPLLMLVFGWWMYYPIDRRLREAVLLRHLDEGRPVYPIWSRMQYVINQLRHQLALMLVPLLLMLAWTEFNNMQLYPRYPKVAPWLQLPGVLLIFLFTPLIISRIWDTCALPPGELRDMLTAMCRRHHVRVRELLLWRTFGGMINAAVMGFIAPLRFILLTDALLDMLSLKQIEAVMAHELAHVRRQHMFWLLLVVGVTSVILQTSCLLLAYMIIPRISQSADTIVLAGIDLTWLIDPQTITYIAIAITLVGWLLVFGWVSRRFERQADTFAVQHLTQGDTVDAQSAQTMIDALQQVAVLNHIPTTKRSWRHGSIAWRQQYLNTLVGLALDKLSINRTVLIIKIVAVTGLSLILGLMAASYKGLLPFE